MTASSEDPTAEAATARTEQSDVASLPLPRRSRGQSAIAEAVAALGSAAASEPGVLLGPGSVPPPPMSAAAAEFVAMSESAPNTGVSAFRTDVPTVERADHHSGGTGAPSRSAPRPARRRRTLSAAAVTGALIIGSLFLMNGVDDSKRRPSAAVTESDMSLDGGRPAGTAGSFDSPSPSPSPSGEPSAVQTGATNATQRPSSQPTQVGAAPATTNGDTQNGGALTGTSPGSSSSADDSAEGVLIRGHASGRCIDVPGGDAADHTRLQIRDCTGAARQKWRFASDGTVRAMGKCMDVDGGSREDGAWIKVVGCNGTGAQRFRLNAAHDLVNIQADKCVDVTDLGTGNGAPLQLWSCTGGDNQKWSTG
ncbi:ricin-type beta-trefoil lectin domain protein [Streptomyces canus]|uniref:ricin-type beta-trefoil lectin domain protein n=1 Tax=Streptomyces canus TaxID=58343 RepID=UPI003820FE9F